MKKQQNLAAHDECEEEVNIYVLNQFNHFNVVIRIAINFWVEIPKKLITILLRESNLCTINSAFHLSMSMDKIIYDSQFRFDI